MSNITSELDGIIHKLEDIKCDLETKESERHRCIGFIQEFLGNIYESNLSYNTRLTLSEFFDKYDYINYSEDNGYYGFNILDKRRFTTFCDQVKEELGLKVNDDE